MVFSRNFQCKTVSHWLWYPKGIFHFDTENREEQLKNHPVEEFVMENSGTHWKCVLKTWFSIIISQVFPKKTVSSSIFKGGWLSRALVTKLSCPHLHSLTIYIFRSGLCQSSNWQLSLVSTQYVGPSCTLQCFVLYF